MPVTTEPMRITQITLRPRIVVAAGTDLGQVAELLERAHGDCYVANTLNIHMVIDPDMACGRRRAS